MKPKNFPGRKLVRRLNAKGLNLDDYKEAIQSARNTKSKKHRT